MERKYLKRYMDNDLERYLRMIGAVLIVGSKWCGKNYNCRKTCTKRDKITRS